MFQLLFTVLTQDFSHWVKAKVNFLNKYVHFSVLSHNQTTAHCKCTPLYSHRQHPLLIIKIFSSNVLLICLKIFYVLTEGLYSVKWKTAGFSGCTSMFHCMYQTPSGPSRDTVAFLSSGKKAPDLSTESNMLNRDKV